MLWRLEPVVEPGTRHTPVANNRRFRNAKHGRDLGVFQAAEIAQLHYLSLTRVESAELVERGIQIEKIDRQSVRGGDLVNAGEVHVRAAVTSFAGILRTREVNQDLAHETRGEGEKMCAVGPFDRGISD